MSASVMDGGLSQIPFSVIIVCFGLYSCGLSTVVGVPMAAKAFFVDGDIEACCQWAVSAVPIVGPTAALILPF